MIEANEKKREIPIRTIVSGFLEIVAISLFVLGSWMISPILAAFVGGIGLILVALAIDPPAKKPKIPKLPRRGEQT